MDAKTIVILVLEAASFATGYGMAYLQGQSALEKERKSTAELVANQERIAHEKLVKAQDALDASRRDIDRLTAELERVRVASDRRVQRVSATACKDERAAVARCESLLKESCGLLAEGGSLLQRNAAIHDATIQAVK